MAKIQPVNDYILIEPDKAETQTASGLYIPETAGKDKPQRGTVKAVGPGKIGDDNERMPLSVKVGDKVLYTKYGPTEVKVDGEELIFVQESDLIAIVA